MIFSNEHLGNYRTNLAHSGITSSSFPQEKALQRETIPRLRKISSSQLNPLICSQVTRKREENDQKFRQQVAVAFCEMFQGPSVKRVPKMFFFPPEDLFLFAA
jgi:hypothetical protein